MIALFIIFVTVVFVNHALALVKQHLWKELLIFMVLLSLGTVYALGQFYAWPLPNPTQKMEYLFVPLYEALG